MLVHAWRAAVSHLIQRVAPMQDTLTGLITTATLRPTWSYQHSGTLRMQLSPNSCTVTVSLVTVSTRPAQTRTWCHQPLLANRRRRGLPAFIKGPGTVEAY